MSTVTREARLARRISDLYATDQQFADARPSETVAQAMEAPELRLPQIVQTVVDGYGRVTQAQVTSDPDGVDLTDTTYDAFGRKASVSNPYRSPSDPTYGVTSYYYDALGRPTSVVEPDASAVTTSYSGNTATSTDEASKKRSGQTDALGRLTKAVEDPSGLNYQTLYQYDILGDLLCVEQHGSASTGTGCAAAPSNNTSM